MNWKQQIEAQIAALNSLTPEYPDGDGFYGELYGTDAADVYDASRSMQALLDVAVAAEKCGDGKALLNELWDALDKLREVSDE